MPVAYTRAPQPIWAVIAKNAKMAVGGRLESYKGSEQNVPKAIFQDPAGNFPYPNPLPIRDNGTLPSMYFADDEAYFLQFYDADGELIDSVENFTGGSGGSAPVTEIVDLFNHLINGQFLYQRTIPGTLTTEIQLTDDKWYFRKSNTNATDVLEFVDFIVGQSDVPAQPTQYLHYQCTGVGAGGETYKDYEKQICSVIGFNNTTISLGLAAKSTTTSQIQIIARQFFGTGGSPSATVNTVLATFTLTSSWANYSASFAIPSVSGKTLGSNGDDYLSFIVRLPLNAISDVDVINLQFQHGTILANYEHQSNEYIAALIKGNELPRAAIDGSDAGKSIVLANDGKTQVWGRGGEVGDFAWTGSPNPTEDTGKWAGWLKLQSTVRNVSRTTYADLFADFGTTYGAGDGSTTFGLPALAGRVPIAACDASSGITARTAGQLFGEETHTMIEAELAAHTHSSVNGEPFATIITDSAPNNAATGARSHTSGSQHTTSTGSSTPFNVIQPSAAIGAVFVKY